MQPEPAQSQSPNQPAAADDTSDQSLLEVALSGAIALAKEGKAYSRAEQQFQSVKAQVQKESEEAAKLLQQMWSEYISAQRASTFWESMSDAEKDLSDKMAQSNVQLKRNYMRLMQEQ